MTLRDDLQLNSEVALKMSIKIISSLPTWD